MSVWYHEVSNTLSVEYDRLANTNWENGHEEIWKCGWIYIGEF